MVEKDVVITYETLFELLRLEKNREELQKLDRSFFGNVLSYLTEKRSNFDSSDVQSVLFASDDKEKARLELDNIRRIIKELYDKREKKIVSSALNNARTGVVLANTGNMLPSERLLFSSLSSMLFEFRKSVLMKLVCYEQPDVEALSRNLLSSINVSMPTDTESPKVIEAESEDANPVPYEAPEEPKELKTTPNSNDSGVNDRKIRFLTPIGEIVGPDLKIYGPFEEGDEILLPSELARVLLEKRQAEDMS